MTQPSSSTSRKNVLPYVLIGVGLVVLLANFGLFRFGALLDAVVNVLNLWPVAIIAVGADMVTRGKYRALIAAAAVIAGLVLLMVGGGFGGGADARTNDIAIPLAGASRAEVRLEMGVATLDLTTADGSGDVLWGTIETARGETLNSSSRMSGDTVIVSVASQQRTTIGFTGRERSWNLTLDDEVPTTLNVNSGVGRSTLDLRDLDLRGLQVDAGVGDVTVTLPDEGAYSGSVNAGVGSVGIRVPQDAAVRLTVRAGLGRVNVRGGFAQDGDVYTSPAYRAGEPAAELRVEGGVGELTVETVR